MRYYCTLFDKNYLPKGLAMYHSLKRHSSEPFMLHVLPLDAETHAVMSNLSNIELHTWQMFANREKMPHREWCWRLASQFTEELLMRYGLMEVTYLDADLFFFSDPSWVHKEIGKRSIGIIPHRLIPSKQHLEVNGKFNVGWVTFKDTAAGRECLARWAAQVRERCDATTCGDQKYLDEWPERYGDEVAIIEHIGANVAPWNLANYQLYQYKVYPSGGAIYLNKHDDIAQQQLIFYHFHEYEHDVRLTHYELRPEDIDLIYKPYIAAIDKVKEQIEHLRLQSR